MKAAVDDGVGAAMCWGANRLGQLGTEAPVTRNCAPTYELPCTEDPVPVAGGLRFTQLSTGLHTTCGVTVENALYCWGTNEQAQLGIGRIVDGSPVPVRVVDPIS